MERTNVLLDNCTFVNPTKSIGHVVGELEPSSLLFITDPPKVSISKCKFSHLTNIGKETFISMSNCPRGESVDYFELVFQRF